MRSTRSRRRTCLPFRNPTEEPDVTARIKNASNELPQNHREGQPRYITAIAETRRGADAANPFLIWTRREQSDRRPLPGAHRLT